MVIDRDQQYQEMAMRGKYKNLYAYLCGLGTQEWRTSFREIESIIGLPLPPSAHRYTAWWANEGNDGRHTQAQAWGAAGWETADLDLDAETLLFRRRERRETARGLSLNEVWPVHRAKAWPEGLSLRREDIYEDRNSPLDVR